MTKFNRIFAKITVTAIFIAAAIAAIGFVWGPPAMIISACVILAVGFIASVSAMLACSLAGNI